ncbi:MAG: nucleotidyltransferase domain-containing protein [Armatimonadetes bacterium]|nr:nucleotidyltransferase domain-containing protein [Armatimonadota bacterium]
MIDLIRDNLDKIRALCERYHVQRLEVFGSAADGRYREGESDLDFIVEFEPTLSEGIADMFFGLVEGLQKLFGTPVDLIMLDGRTRVNPYLQRQIDLSRQAIYERSREGVPV